MLYLFLLLGAAFAAQIVLSCVQMKAFSKEFVALRRRGKVVCGRKAGGLRAGAIVMFLIDDNGYILDGKKMEGITVLARVKDLPGYQGRYLGALTAADGPLHHHNLCKAIADAALTYSSYTAGEPIREPPSPFQKIGIGLSTFVQRMKSYSG